MEIRQALTFDDVMLVPAAGSILPGDTNTRTRITREIELGIPLISAAMVLDIGAGTSRDAAAFAELGNAVTAVEPVDEMRTTASALHPSPMITWVKDSLPDLAVVSAGKHQYDLVMLTAVWMHLDTEEREKAMPVVVALARDGGKMMMSLRHGPANPNRRVFDVPADETIALAERYGLSCVLQQSAPSVGALNRAAGVTWTLLVFVKNAAHPPSG